MTPEQRIDPVTALAAFTAGSAWHNHDDDRRGSVTVGKVADLVVMDRNPFVAGFAETAVDLVMVGGHWARGLEAG